MNWDIEKITEALERVSLDCSVFVNRETHEFFDVLDDMFDLVDKEDEDLLDWEISIKEKLTSIDVSSSWVKLPSAFEINEYRIMEAFAYTLPNGLNQLILEAIKGKGAFSRFKNTCFKHCLMEDWYAFKKAALKQLAKAWCEAHEDL